MPFPSANRAARVQCYLSFSCTVCACMHIARRAVKELCSDLPATTRELSLFPFSTAARFLTCTGHKHLDLTCLFISFKTLCTFFQTLILIHVAYSKRGFCAHALIYSCSRVKIGHGDKGSDTISAATSSRFRRFCQTRSLRRFGQLGVKKKSRPTLCNKHAQEKKQ